MEDKNAGNNGVKNEIETENAPCTCENCTDQPRYRSKAAWASLLALTGMLLGTFGVYEKLGIDGTQYQTLTEMLLAALVAFGILNNPTDRASF